MRLAPAVVVGALLLAAFACPPSRAEEKKPVAEADVPKAAVAALRKKFPLAKVTGWASEEEDGKLVYVAKTEWSEKADDGKVTVHKVEVDLAADGKILEEEEVVPATELPQAVTKAIAASKHAKAKIARVERKIVAEKADAPIYEVLLTEDGKSVEVEYDADGKVLEESGDDKGGKGDARGLTSYTIDRTFSVPPARLFRAFTTPDDLAAWVWGAQARDVRVQIDLRPGGAVEVTTAGPTAGEPRLGYRGIFVDVVPGRRLVHTVHWDSDVGYNGPGMHPVDEVMVIEVGADPAGSRLTWTHHGIPDDGRSAAAHEGAVRATLNDLAKHLAASPR